MHSLINLIPRKHSSGKPYFQARFFSKSGKLISSVSFHNIESRAKAYLYAREKLEKNLTPAMPKEEIEQYGILSKKEVKSILALPDNNPNEARNTLITLLGITCGLGVSEIINLKRDQVFANDMILIETPNNGYRIIPLIGNVKTRLVKLSNSWTNSRYVIPNIKNIDKPCDPISISRGLSSVLSKIGISKERNIVPSVLQETFITLLVASDKLQKRNTNMETLDYLCGFSMPSMELSKRIKDSITIAISCLMTVLENYKSTPAIDMNWYEPLPPLDRKTAQ
jgi:integrase